MKTSFLKVRNFSVNYFGGYQGISSVSFDLNHNEVLPIFGKKYSGKSSLLRGIAGLEKHVFGELNFNEDVFKEMVYSFSYETLKNNKTVYEELAYPLKIRNIENKEYIKSRAAYYKIEHLLDKKIKKLNKAEKILVALCRALIRNAKIYLLDDPLKDLSNRSEIFNLLKEDLKGKTVIYTTSVLEEAFKLSDKVGIISYGRLCQIGTFEQLLNRPATIEVLGAIKTSSFIKAILYKEDDLCKFNYNNCKYITSEPINDIYLNSEIIIPVIDGVVSNSIYFDKDSEYIISKGEDNGQ